MESAMEQYLLCLTSLPAIMELPNKVLGNDSLAHCTCHSATVYLKQDSATVFSAKALGQLAKFVQSAIRV